MEITQSTILHKKNYIHSKFLNRKVRVDVFLPQNYLNFNVLQTLFLNDGQDFEQLDLINLLEKHNQECPDRPLMVVAMWANKKRMHEYGTVGYPDYAKRGNLADEYADFMRLEVITKFKKKYPNSIQAGKTYFAGFSLGGLSAFDLTWEYPVLFAKVGVFSGSFWWRSKAYEEGYVDNDRIMHNKIRLKRGVDLSQKFWFECGTADEASDRNNSGIIDSIEDTLDIMKELEMIGFSKENMTYVEIEDGEHNFHTWKAVFSEFLKWLTE